MKRAALATAFAVVFGAGAMTYVGPMASDDWMSTNEQTEVNVAVLTNDMVLSAGSITVSLVSVPAHGTAVVEADDSITYLPEAGFLGTDAFTYELVNHDGESDQAMVYVQVVEPEHAVIRTPGDKPALAARPAR